MRALRSLSVVALVLGFAQAVFGAIVRITGSGLGCGDHWPKCMGAWFPPLDRPDLIIEITHRYIAATLCLAVAVLAWRAWRDRRSLGVAGRGGILTPALTAAGLVVAAALFGAVTVKVTLDAWAVATHMAIAMSLLAVLVVAATRSGALGGAAARGVAAAPATGRSARAALGLGFVVLLFGSLTANVPGAGPACQGFPLCSGALPSTGLQAIQFTHRVLAILLALHVVGLVIGSARRRDPAGIRGATVFALGCIGAQILIAVTLVEMRLPPVLRSLHQATGFLIWLALVTLVALIDLGARAPLPVGVRDGEKRREAIGHRTSDARSLA